MSFEQEVERYKDLLYGAHDDIGKLYEATCTALARAPFPENQKWSELLLSEVLARCDDLGIPRPHYHIGVEILKMASLLYEREGLNPPPPPDYTNLEGIARGTYKDLLLSIQRRALNRKQTLEIFSDAFVEACLALIKRLPSLATGQDDAFESYKTKPSIPLTALVADIGDTLDAIVKPFLSEAVQECGLYKHLVAQFRENVQKVGKKTPDNPIEAYLSGTPLAALFGAKIPFEIPMDDRMEHTVIVGGTGHGKTQLLQSIIAADLESDDPPAMVVIDSTGAMVQRIQKLALFNGRLKDRLLIIDPELDPVPALNPFDISAARFGAYESVQREQIQGEVIDLFNYVFSTINNPLTTRMQTAFAFMVRLILSIPGSNIHTLLQLLDDDPPKGNYDQATFKQHIDKLDPTTQHFFKAQYYTGRDGGLREQIRGRVFDILRVPAFERMFSSVNKVDFFTEMNRGSIILVNTSENLLKVASATFGRYIVARVMAAAFERATIAPDQRKPALLIVDECAPYLDDTFEKLLTRVRQFKLGVVMAFQHLEQTSEKVRSAIASSTSIKYAGGLGYTDSRWLSREMRVEPEFIMAQKRDAKRPPQYTHFACYVRNLTDQGVSLTVPFLTLEKMREMTDAEHAAMLERNRARVSAPAAVAPKPEPAYELPPVVEELQPAALSNPAPAEKPEAPKEPRRAGVPSKDTW